MLGLQGTAVLKLQQKKDLHKNKMASNNFFFLLSFHNELMYGTKFEQDRYSRSKTTAEIRFA